MFTQGLGHATQITLANTPTGCTGSIDTNNR